LSALAFLGYVVFGFLALMVAGLAVIGILMFSRMFNDLRKP
jgi:hypothetical protein